MNELMNQRLRENLEAQRKDAQAIKKNLYADKALALKEGLPHRWLDSQISYHLGVVAGIDGALALLDELEHQAKLELEAG